MCGGGGGVIGIVCVGGYRYSVGGMGGGGGIGIVGGGIGIVCVGGVIYLVIYLNIFILGKPITILVFSLGARQNKNMNNKK